MRRILLAATGTLAATVAVFLYPTSTNRPAATATETVALASAETAVTPSSSESGSTTDGMTPSDDSSAADPTTTAPESAAADATSPPAAATAASGSFTASTSMRFGTVSVTVTVAGGTITDVSATQSSAEAKSEQISSQAIPTLNSEAIAAQSAAIAMVSHATYTSEAYAQSLQAAIDQAFGS